MRVFRRIMLGGGIDINRIPESNKLYYTATQEIVPKEGSLGSNILLSSYDKVTKEGTIYTLNPITTIGERAFASNEYITSIILPPSVKKVEESAFNSADNLSELTLLNGDIEFGYNAFAYSRIKKVIIGINPVDKGYNSNLDLIASNTCDGHHASPFFYSNASLYDQNGNIVTNGTIVRNIGNYTFAGIANIVAVYISSNKGIVDIGTGAFYNSASDFSLGIFNAEELNIHAHAFQNSNIWELFTSSNTPVTINTYAFSKSKITNIPSSIIAFGSYAFEDCTCLKHIVIPTNVSYINNTALEGTMFSNTSLVNYSNLDAETNNYWGATMYELITSDGLCINNSTVEACKPHSTDVVIPDNITNISEYSFQDNKKIKTLTIGNGIIEILKYMCRACSNLTSVIIGDNVLNINSYAFADCNKLKEVYCKASNPPVCYSNTFYNINPGFMIYVPTESVDAYKSATNWSTYADYIVGYDFETNASVE